ncbi:MAG TPA: LacI family DNA-binding transcriptional regulator [Devosia sp.]|uniref:LacI family DNA-binding transcriptional regulator n=1 Tax=Devosia sp. TaxID=1871048 RepID=UPI002DDCE833|nr:LacI family DNA-binding transcriptional regulator [Devosia sp.]HEV2517352.1 LacI family DNA-binding transcriptional regulator [Devosia sp.]
MPPSKKAITLKDVARLAGTTPMTVSNVLNNRAGAVGPDLSARVRRVAQELGYRPHTLARRLRTQRSQIIGVVLVDASPFFLSDPLTAAMLAGLTAALHRLDYSTILHGVRPDEVEQASFLRNIETDGVCMVLAGAKSTRRKVIERVAATNQPLVTMQEAVPDDIKDAAGIHFDDRGGARELTRALVATGVRHVLFLVPALEWAAMLRREAGIREVLGGADGVRLSLVKSADESFEACQAALAGFIAKGEVPDAVIGGNDQMAIAAMRYLQAIGKNVPGDIQVAGFNGLEFGRYTTPELTTVSAPAFRLGEAAANAMFHRLDTGSFPFREMVVPVDVILRGSTRAGGAA